MPSDQNNQPNQTDGIDPALLPDEATQAYAQIAQLQEELTEQRDARREDKFIFIVVSVLLLDVVFFSVMDSFGGPLALLILELLILIPLAKRMGMEEIAEMLDRVLKRIVPKSGEDN